MYICGLSKGNKGILLLQLLREQSVCGSKRRLLEKKFIFKGNSGSEVLLEEVKEQQITAEDRNEIRDDSQDVIKFEFVTQDPRRYGRIHHEPKRYGFQLIIKKLFL